MITRTLHAYAELRRATPPSLLGRIDWLLWGRQQSPWHPKSLNTRRYRDAFNAEKQQTPQPTRTRLRRPKP